MTTLPTPPTRSDPANFSARADAFLSALPGWGEYVEILALAASSGSFQGTYAGGTTYAAGETVVYSGAFYTSLQASNTGNTPSSSPTYWQDLLLTKLTNPVFTGSPIEDRYTITDGAAFEIDPSNGSIQYVTLGSNRTPKATNFLNGQHITLLVDDGASGYTITWTDTTFGPSGIDWRDEEVANLSATGWTAIVIWKEGDLVHGAPAGVYG